MRRESARALGARELAAQRDRGLNDAALNVRDVLEQVAREHPDGSAPGYVLLLARRFCAAKLKRKWRP
jgi:hypothetical protein